MPHLIQILLPVYDNSGEPFPATHYETARDVLIAAFGGLTAYTRAPAEGLWDTGGRVKRDDVVVLEVMTDALDRAWWRECRQDLQRHFRQDEIVVRAQVYEKM
jgi:hypothetical protein